MYFMRRLTRVLFALFILRLAVGVAAAVSDVNPLFSQVLPDLQRGTAAGIPLYLPATIPRTHSTPADLRSIIQTASPDIYDVVIGTCNGRSVSIPCEYAEIQGWDSAAATVYDTSYGQVHLSNGSRAIYVAAVSNYPLGKLMWKSGRYMYTLMLRDGNQSQLTSMANSMRRY